MITDTQINNTICKKEGTTGLDYCNNWEDIGPIIEREKIKLFSSEGVDWKATLVKPHSELGYRVWAKEAETPTRAAALCFVSYLYSKYDSFWIQNMRENERGN